MSLSESDKYRIRKQAYKTWLLEIQRTDKVQSQLDALYKEVKDPELKEEVKELQKEFQVLANKIAKKKGGSKFEVF